MRIRRLISTLFVAVIVFVSLLAFPGAAVERVQAAGDNVWYKAWAELGTVGNEAGLKSQSGVSLQIFVARIIQQLLGFLGIIFFVLILYAGFLWLTSGGGDEQIGKAKKVLTSAGIGLAIVVLAYAITVFVLRAFLRGAGLDMLNP